MRRASHPLGSAARGFTLVEMAVVLAVVGLLLGSLMFTLAAQVEQRKFTETRQRLETARDLLLSYAIVNGRLPCPATATSDGVESPGAGGPCTTYYGGWLPARTLGFHQVDGNGFAIDAWGNRLRYAVSGATPLNSKDPRICRATDPEERPAAPHFTHKDHLRSNGLDCRPSDLLVCRSATGITSSSCGGSANQVMTQNLVVAIILSTGKNFASAPSAASASAAGRFDEAANLNDDPVFVFHTPTPPGAQNGEFDDQLTWITVGELYAKLISAGVLP
jgi:prepilin-type N-terminal cleavage/methylation domain-containing protein